MGPISMPTLHEKPLRILDPQFPEDELGEQRVAQGGEGARLTFVAYDSLIERSNNGIEYG